LPEGRTCTGREIGLKFLGDFSRNLSIFAARLTSIDTLWYNRATKGEKKGSNKNDIKFNQYVRISGRVGNVSVPYKLRARSLINRSNGKRFHVWRYRFIGDRPYAFNGTVRRIVSYHVPEI
jgi:hypothetical protein